MKVAYLLGSLNRGGTETLVLDVFKKASQAPFQVVGIHRKGGAYLPDFQATGEKMIALAPRFVGDLSYFVKLRRLLQRESVGVVHAQQSLDAVYARIACVGTGIKVVQTFHGYDFNAGKWMRRFMRFSARIVDANFYVSEGEKNYYVKSYKLKQLNRQQVVYNGVNFDKLDEQLAQVELPIGGDPALQGFKLAMVGNFVRGREQNTVCQFLKLLQEADVPFDFYFVGRKSESEPWLYDDCVAYCQEHQLLDCVHFLGGRGDVPAILKQLDAFIYSTDHDTFGIAVIEAIAAGVPTFVNDWEVMVEITQQGRWATIYKTKDAADLLKKFITFVDHKEQYKRQAYTHAQEVRSTYSIEQHMLALSNLYKNLSSLTLNP